MSSYINFDIELAKWYTDLAGEKERHNDGRSSRTGIGIHEDQEGGLVLGL